MKNLFIFHMQKIFFNKNVQKYISSNMFYYMWRRKKCVLRLLRRKSWLSFSSLCNPFLYFETIHLLATDSGHNNWSMGGKPSSQLMCFGLSVKLTNTINWIRHTDKMGRMSFNRLYIYWLNCRQQAILLFYFLSIN